MGERQRDGSVVLFDLAALVDAESAIMRTSRARNSSFGSV